VSALLALVITSGCALWKDPDPPAFQRVALQSRVVKDSGGALEGDLHADTTIKGALLAGAGLGVSGAGIGLSLGFGCGPIGAIVCVPVFTVAGLVIGGVTGAVVGGIGGLPWQTAGQVNQILVDLQHRRDFAAEIQREIETEIPREKQTSADQAEAIVTARLDSVDLRQHYSERLSLRIYGSMTQEWDRGSGEPKQRTCDYEFTTATRDVEDWLLDDGELFDIAFTEAIHSFASWMARDLDAFAKRRPLPASEETPATCFQE
jgi:hypothetical protein